MGNSKVELSDGRVLMDLTGDTVTAASLASGVTAHGANGESIVGTAAIKVKHSAWGTSGEIEYVKFAEIATTYQYADMAFTINVVQRKQAVPTTLFIQFSGESGTDPSLGQFQAIGSRTDYWMKKESAGTWGLYAYKAEAYDEIDVLDAGLPEYAKTRIGISWCDTVISSIDGAIKCAAPTLDLRLTNAFGRGNGEQGSIVLNGYGICWGYTQVHAAITSAWSGMYYGRHDGSIAYPLSFASSPAISLASEQTGGNSISVTAGSTNASGINGLYFYAPDARETDVWVHWCARGKLSGW